jgi:hypothetical protein
VIFNRLQAHSHHLPVTPALENKTKEVHTQRAPNHRHIKHVTHPRLQRQIQNAASPSTHKTWAKPSSTCAATTNPRTSSAPTPWAHPTPTAGHVWYCHACEGRLGQDHRSYDSDRAMWGHLNQCHADWLGDFLPGDEATDYWYEAAG